MKLKLLQLATKYGIQIIEFQKGYVQVHVAKWNQYEQQLMEVIEKIKDYPEIKAIELSEHTKTIVIYYDETMFSSETAIKNWLHILEAQILTSL